MTLIFAALLALNSAHATPTARPLGAVVTSTQGNTQAAVVPGECAQGKHKEYDYCGQMHCLPAGATLSICNPPAGGAMVSCSGSHPACSARPQGGGVCANGRHGEYTQCQTATCVPDGATLPNCTTIPRNGCRNDCRSH